MNTLSWFLYLADVVGNLGVFLLIFSFLSLVIGVVGFAIHAARLDKLTDSRGRAYDCEEATLDAIRVKRNSVVIKGAAIAFILGMVATFIPSTKTMYMIAASEVGETAVKTPEAQETLDLLQQKLREMLAPKPANQPAQ